MIAPNKGYIALMDIGVKEPECLWCGQDDPEENYTWRKPYPDEPGSWACADCMEERPWK